MTDSYLEPRQHGLALSLLVLGGVLLACAPNAILGLQYQCVLHSLTGLRCPFCGMTRDFVLMAHGSLPRNNPGSLVTALGLYVAYPLWLLMVGWRRRCWVLINRERLIKALVIAMGVLFVGNNIVA